MDSKIKNKAGQIGLIEEEEEQEGDENTINQNKTMNEVNSKHQNEKDKLITNYEYKQKQKKEAIMISNEYLTKLGLSFQWDRYDTFIEGKGLRGEHFGKFQDRIRIGDRFYYGYFFEKKSLQDPNLSKCDIDNPNSHFDDNLFEIAYQFYQYLQTTKKRISELPS